MSWVLDHAGDIARLAADHVLYAGLPLILGLLLALPLGWLAHRWTLGRGFILSAAGLLYTIPSLALFILMPLVLGTQILDPLNVIAAMTLYTVALLVRTVVDGLGSVPDSVEQAATAVGYTPLRRVLGVELPLAVPVIAAGLRVAAVSNVSIVSVASLIGVGQLGDLLTDGFNRDIGAELAAGIVACVLLALVFDLAIQGLARVATPWRRAETAGLRGAA
ncbi:ABC transporter permease [Janibacter sp. G1551]|uniref:ABC transporter permease n=1 Tax=Janibacter sp. G1551 TaxID=3420440 RepID=UPI003D01F286